MKTKFLLTYSELASILSLIMGFAWSPFFILLSIYFLIGVVAIKKQVKENI
jgi:hypothetical protein